MFKIIVLTFIAYCSLWLTPFFPKGAESQVLNLDSGYILSSSRYIKNFEGLKLKTYKDTKRFSAIGWGHQTNRKYKISKRQAERYLVQDIKRMQKAAFQVIGCRELTREQTIALTSFVYNIGTVAFTRSAVAKNIREGYMEKAAHQMLRWKKVDKKKFKVLVKRRFLEFKLFMSNYRGI